MKRWTTLVFSFALIACSSTLPRNADGTISIDCSGGGPSWGPCHRTARKQCPDAAYDVVVQLTDDGTKSTGLNDSLTHAGEVSRTLVIRCISRTDP